MGVQAQNRAGFGSNGVAKRGAPGPLNGDMD